jgi:CheY-like chemotaxis protein
MATTPLAPTVNSLLRAIVKLDGEALVLQVGKIPHIVRLNGNVEIGSRPLPADVIADVTGGVLPAASLALLRTFGTAVHKLAADQEFNLDRFVVTATGRGDLSLVIRRERIPAVAAPDSPASAKPVRFPSLVLLIDDSLDQLDLYEFALADTFAVMTASRGKTGIGLAIAEQPDAIVLDLTMPQMDGWEVCRQLKGRQETVGIPIIVLTAEDDPRLKEKAARLGAAELLHKPCDIDRLRERVGWALQH